MTFRFTRRNLVVQLCLATLFAGGCASKEEEVTSEPHPEVSVEVATAAPSEIQLKVDGDGILYPREQAAISPKISAPIRKFYVERGARVRDGQLLAELENADLAAAVAEGEASLAQAEANYEAMARGSFSQEVQKAESDVRAAKDVLDAAQKLYDSRLELLRQGALAQRDVNDAQVALSQARTQYENAQAQLAALTGVSREQSLKAAAAERDAARARLEAAKTQLGYSRIMSPIDGVVTDRPLFAGEMAQSGTPMLTVMDVSRVIARAHFSQEEAAQVRVGDAATLLSSESDGAGGRVTQVSPALDPSSTTVEVWIEAENPNGKLKPGASVKAQIVARTIPKALVVPASAILTDDSGETSVIVVSGENKPEHRTVTVGIRADSKAQVTQGLEAGEQVVTTGAFELANLEPDVLEKTKVRIQESAKEDEK